VTLRDLTSVKSETQMVLISNLQIKNTYCPSLSPADAAGMDQLVRAFVSPTVWISMQRFVSCIPKPLTAPTGVQLNNDPPAVFLYESVPLLEVRRNKPFLCGALTTGENGAGLACSLCSRRQL
jgi:hypothetical protein